MLYQLSHFRSINVASHLWCREPGSNWRHRDFQSRALPTELSRLELSTGCPSARRKVPRPTETPQDDEACIWASPRGVPDGASRTEPSDLFQTGELADLEGVHGGVAGELRRRLMRSTIGGCVEKSAEPPPSFLSGLTI